MKITRDDIKEMVTDVLGTLINENKINQTTIVFDYFKENPEDIYTNRPEVIAAKLNIGVQSIKQVTTVWKKCEKYFEEDITRLNEPSSEIKLKLKIKSNTLVEFCKQFFNDFKQNITNTNPLKKMYAWFINNGGNNIPSHLYQRTICELVRSCDLDVPYKYLKDFNDNNDPFGDFVQVFKFKSKYNFNITDNYLLYCAYRYFLPQTSIPDGVSTFENEKRFETENDKTQDLKRGDNASKTAPYCIKFLYNKNISPDTQISSESIHNLIDIISQNTNEIYSLIQIILSESRHINHPPQNMTKLYEVVWLVCWILSYKSYHSNKFSSILQQYDYNLLGDVIAFSLQLSFVTLYGNTICNTFNKINQLFGNYSFLYNPSYNITQEEMYNIYLKLGGKFDVLTDDIKIGLPIEKTLKFWSDCFLYSKSIPSEKFGGPEIFTMENLLNPNFKATDALKNIKSAPKAYKKIEKLMENGDKKEYTFFDIVNEDYTTKNKTQDALFSFLSDNTKPEYQWVYEYNRYGKRVDKELGAKSIDMLCDTNRQVYCVEYQGEQHFRPLNVRYGDDIFFGTNDFKNEIIAEYKNICSTPKMTKSNAKNLIKSVIVKKLFEISRERAEQNSYFNELLIWLSTNTENNIDIFNVEKTDRFPHYILSPQRFMDEIDVYLGQLRDDEKLEIVQKRNWVMIYVLPGSTSISQEDREYAESKKAIVFYWNANGKEQIKHFLYKNGLGKNINEGLFTKIINEYFNNKTTI